MTGSALTRATQVISHFLDDAGDQAIRLHLDWDPGLRLHDDYEYAARFHTAIVYAGTAEHTFVSTAEEYISRQWPQVTGVLDALEQAYDDRDFTHTTTNDLSGCKMVIDVKPGLRPNLVASGVYVTLTGDKAIVRQIIEALAFLATAFRANDDPARIGFAHTIFDTKASDILSIRVGYSPFETDAPYLHWTKMARCPAIAHDWPVPSRDDIGQQQKGLELSFDILVPLSGVQFRSNINGKVSLASFHSS